MVEPELETLQDLQIFAHLWMMGSGAGAAASEALVIDSDVDILGDVADLMSLAPGGILGEMRARGALVAVAPEMQPVYGAAFWPEVQPAGRGFNTGVFGGEREGTSQPSFTLHNHPPSARCSVRPLQHAQESVLCRLLGWIRLGSARVQALQERDICSPAPRRPNTAHNNESVVAGRQELDLRARLLVESPSLHHAYGLAEGPFAHVGASVCVPSTGAHTALLWTHPGNCELRFAARET